MDLYTCFFKVCLSHVNACWVGVGTIPDTNHIYREKTDKRILKKNPWKDYRLHVTVLVLVIINDPQGVYYGGTIAAPVAREIFENILPYLDK